jgi:uncharacterized protein (TIGR02996 family)
VTDGTALLAAILAEPADDTALLAYADWLEENGDPVRAAVIRAGVANPTEYLVAYNYHSAGWTFLGAKRVQPRGTASRLRRELPPLKSFRDPQAVWFFCRGFLNVVRLSPTARALHCDFLRRNHPIEVVELTFTPVAGLA